jgi:hypothetical protein
MDITPSAVDAMTSIMTLVITALESQKLILFLIPLFFIFETTSLLLTALTFVSEENYEWQTK